MIQIQFPMFHVVPSKGRMTFEVYSKDTIVRVFIVNATSPKMAEKKARRFCDKHNHRFKASAILLTQPIISI